MQTPQQFDFQDSNNNQIADYQHFGSIAAAMKRTAMQAGFPFGVAHCAGGKRWLHDVAANQDALSVPLLRHHRARQENITMPR